VDASQPLSGRLIAVTGAGGSLGPVLVPVLAARGARLALAGRSLDGLRDLAGDADVEAVDLLDETATRTWAERLRAAHGAVDGVVHLVGGWRGGTAIEDAPVEDWAAMEAQLVRTTQVVTRAFLAPLLASGRGRFVIVSSGQAQAPTHTNAAYAAAKAAAETWTLALADRLRGSGSTANIVVVGAIVTPAMRRESPGKDYASFTPAEEIAEAICYLAGDAAAAMNGQRVTLRGGA
jgi:NAD(P)-dependent dehydrogenase (short-subunit alcohol dehydrogenase family)